MISNPVTYFINGNETRSFTYEGGEKLWHFAPSMYNNERYMGVNIIFFADDIEHAKDVLERMFTFALETNKSEYIGLERFKTILDEKEKWIIVPAPTNQIYKVGWASNDTLS